MKHIVITGVSSGIGYGIAREFLRKGYFVFGSVRNEKDADRLQTGFGPNFKPLIFDITDEAAVKQGVETVRNIVGGNGLAGLINNAGIAVSGPLMHTTTDRLRQQFEVNVIGQMIVTREFLPLLGAFRDCPFPPGKSCSSVPPAARWRIFSSEPMSEASTRLRGWRMCSE